VVNVTLSTLFILGPGPIPELGWKGLAIGTACGHIMGGLILLGLFCKGRAGLRLGSSSLRPDRQICRELLRIGVPGGLDVLAVLTCHLVYVAIINSLGTVQAAAHGLGVQIEALAYLPGAAFSVAATTMVGQLLGAGEHERATRGALVTCLTGCSLMTASALVFYFAGGLLTTFFTGNPDDDVGRLTTELLKIVAIATPPLGVLQILTGALRGAGDTRVPLLITLIGLAGVRVPGACLLAWTEIAIPGTEIVLPGLGWGIYGAWWAMVADVLIRATLIGVRFWRGAWRV
jgi:putative MATE family efflux protein